ncbi:MAG: hypothetical protein NTX26_00215 [Candidatus Parcubacteria bacterium]|nr:hypothetical protein [Candidatus Parcubacteria bacterium]
MEEINNVPDLQAQETELASTIRAKQSELTRLEEQRQSGLNDVEANKGEATAYEAQQELAKIALRKNEIYAELGILEQREAELKHMLGINSKSEQKH